LLRHIIERCSSPLTVPRDKARRVRSNCRTSAILLVAMPRHQGIPARKRTGFAAYIDFIHEIAEYWDASGEAMGARRRRRSSVHAGIFFAGVVAALLT
jgi:transglutaminase-like putative cysteine protease